MTNPPYTRFDNSSARQGVDPRTPKLPTFERVARFWLRQKLTANPAWSEAARFETRMKKHIRPAIGSHAIDKIEASDITRLRDKLPSVSVRRACVRHIGDVLTYAIAEGYRTDSPCKAILTGIKPAPVEHRTHVEPKAMRECIPAIAACESVPETMRRLSLFLMFIPLRKNEAQRARWEEMKGNVWTIPAERMKGRKAFQIQIPQAAMRLLGTPQTEGFIFQHTNGKEIPDTAYYNMRAKLDLPFQTHGIRHTFETWAVRAGHDADMVHRCTGHHINDGTQKMMYQHHAYVKECNLILQE